MAEERLASIVRELTAGYPAADVEATQKES